MRFPDSFLDELRRAMPVLEAVQRAHKMRKAGSARYEAVDDPSLMVNTTENFWYDHGKGQRGGDVFEWEMFSSGCTFEEAVKRVAEAAHIPLPRSRASAPARRTNGAAAAGPEPPPAEPSDYGAAPAPRAPLREITKTYDYRNADGSLVYQVCRQEWIGDDGRRKKSFLQRRPYGPVFEDSEQQPWIWGLSDGVYIRSPRDHNFYPFNKDRADKWKGAERLEAEACPHMLYRLAELREEMAQAEAERRVVMLEEGEKNCDTLIDWGFVAITNSGGAGNWRPEHADELRGADVVILENNDEAGRKRGHAIALSLRNVAKRVRVLRWPQFWPGCPDKGDVTDWRDLAGGTADKLFEILDRLKDWSPEPPTSAFGAVRYRDIDAHAAPLVWTVKGILQKATVSLWYGATQSGKSFLLTDLFMSIARGSPWMGHRTRPGLVIYQTGEGGDGFRQRIKAYRQHSRVSPEDDVPFVYLPTRINLFMDDADVGKLLGEIQAWASYYDHPLEAVGIDTFNAASGGANENANQDVGRVLERCRRIAEETGAHVALVHHTPATGDKPRGHSSIMADVETAVSVLATEETEDGQADDGRPVSRVVRHWKLTKQKDEAPGIAGAFVLRRIVLGRDEDEDEISSCVVEPLQTAAAAVQGKRIVPAGWVQLNKDNEDIFRALLRALDKVGDQPPPACGAPAGTRAVKVGQWEAELLTLAIGHEDITPTVRNRYKMKVYRAAKAWLPDAGGKGLIIKKIVSNNEAWVWRTERRVFPIDRLPPSSSSRRAEPEMIRAPGETDDDLPFN